MFQLWRGSLNLEKIPENLLLRKGGNRSVPKNYHPIALTSHITKAFERVLSKAAKMQDRGTK